jgi:AcrR family transcriptional regulator
MHGNIATETQSKAPTSAELTKANIIEVATAEFSEKGFSGARVDEIAALTNTSKRMIYYYFVDKKGLFVAVLENAYGGIRKIEAELNLDHLTPLAAIRTLVGFSFDYQFQHESFVRLVMDENIHYATRMEGSKNISNLNLVVIERLQRIYERGCIEGVFRSGLDAIDIHMTISALAFFNVSNRHTFSKIFNRDLAAKDVQEKRRVVVIETVERYLLV